MKLYIDNIIPRIKQFSESLDRKEVFIEIPWVIIDENLNQQKYIFKRDGDLIMSLNGQVTIGRWEYISGAKSLLIDRISDKILLNQNFIDPAVMVLKKDGYKEENFILANEILLPDLNVSDYLKRLYYKKNNISIQHLKSGEILEINFTREWGRSNDDSTVDCKVTIEGELVPDSLLELAKTNKKYVIKDSKVCKILISANYNTDKGLITVDKQEFSQPSKNDFVFQNGKKASDGKYRIGFMNYIIVQNGQIKSTSFF